MSCPRCNTPAAEETLREFGGVCPKCLLDFSEEQDAPAFPNLEILEMLGQGGMGVVYKAVQKNLGRTVALKVLSPHLSADPEFVERFTREARALASLSHPNIVGIYDSGIHDHVPYLVMEYVDGTPLRTMLASKKLTSGQVLEVIPQICDALHYAHAHGVVHRDIKPENILVDRGGRVKIADFGLAKLASLDETRITKTGFVMGSPHYMAPEQFTEAGKVDHRADIYSLGVVFYEMLTGEIPMGRFKPPSEKAAVDRRLDPVVLKSLEREPQDRWQSADEVKARVTRLDDDPAPAPRLERKQKMVIAVVAAVALVAIAVAIVLDSRPTPRTSADDARTAIGGPVLVIGAMVAVLVLLAGPIRGAGMKRAEPWTGPRKQNFYVGVGAGVAVLVATAVIWFTAAAPARLATPPRAPTTSARQVVRTFPDPRSLRVEDFWPTPHELSSGGKEEVSDLLLENLLARSELPPGIDADVDSFQGSDVGHGKVRILGLQFKSVSSCLRWWEAPLGGATYRFACGTRGIILIRHDGSAEGRAIAKRLEVAVETAYADAHTNDRRK